MPDPDYRGFASPSPSAFVDFTVEATEEERRAHFARAERRAAYARTHLHERLVAAGAEHEAVAQVLDAFDEIGMTPSLAVGVGTLHGDLLMHGYALYDEEVTAAPHASVRLQESWQPLDDATYEAL